ncbi:MAG: hypothetical protein ACM3SR_05880 [Ignavibacteriales bacterium]
MKDDEIREFIGVPMEAVIMDSKMVLRGTIKLVQNGLAQFSSIEEVFVLVHGKRLSIKFMLSGSFADLETLLKNLWFPYSLFDKCRRLKI